MVVYVVSIENDHGTDSYIEGVYANEEAAKIRIQELSSSLNGDMVGTYEAYEVYG